MDHRQKRASVVITDVQRSVSSAVIQEPTDETSRLLAAVALAGAFTVVGTLAMNQVECL